MSSKLKSLTGFERAGLVVALWLFLALVVAVGRVNLPTLFRHLPGLGVACLGLCGLVVGFSILAAAIHITVDLVRGKYPYGK